MNIILIHFTVQPDQIERFLAAVEANARASLQEPGCLRFDVMQHPADPAHVWLYEMYQDEDAIAAHQQTDHYQQCRQDIKDLQARPKITHQLVNHYPSDSEMTGV